MSSRLTEYSFLALAAKKAATYVLEQNWFADPLEVKAELALYDNLIREIATDFKDNDVIEYYIQPVEVPKAIVEGKVRNKVGRVHKLRQLAHLPFKAQVASAAILMMLADEWDSKFGSPEDISCSILGNRLDCSGIDGSKRFRLGSKTTYRFWADDYSRFVSHTSRRFNQLIDELEGKRRICLVSTDLSSFYPSIDLNEINRIIATSSSISDEEKEHIKKFISAIEIGMKSAGLTGLPQGMIGSGFLANIFLHSFDREVCANLSSHSILKNKVSETHFYSRYVDDIRLVVTYDPPKSKPSKDVAKHPAFIALNAFVTKIGMKVSIDKTHILDLDRNGAKLTEGLLAEHMQDLSNKAYGALIPSKSESLAKSFELLFSIDSTSERKPSSQEVQRNKYNPVIDGPGVRPDSRKRFAAGRFRRLYFTYRDCSSELSEINKRFVSEMYREWKSNPSQIRLLFYAFDLSDYNENLIEDSIDFLNEYPNDLTNLEASHWVPFIKASIIRTFIDRAIRTNFCPKVVSKMAISSISNQSPWYLKSLSWQLLACYRIGVSREVHDKSIPTELSVKRAYSFWRFCMTPHKTHRDLIRPYILMAKSVSVSKNSLEQILNSTLKNIDDDRLATSLVVDSIKELLSMSNLFIKSKAARGLAVRLGINVTMKGGARPKQKKISKSSESSILYSILNQKYRDPLHCVELFIKIVNTIRFQENLESLATSGKINPFSFFIKPSGQVIFRPKEAHSGWASPEWRTIDWLESDFVGKNWAWPLGLLMRLCLTANRTLVYGAPPSHRYNMYFTQSRLCREDGFAPESLLKVLSRLLAWPGTLVQPYANFTEIYQDLNSVLAELKELSMDRIRILTGPNPMADVEASKILLLPCQVFNGLPKDQMLTDAVRSRKMVLYALDEAEQRIQTTKALDIHARDQSVAIVVAFPELSVPKEAFGDIFRFVKKNKVIVLFGAWPAPDLRGNYRNTIYWIFPGMDPTGRVDVQAIKQDKIFPIEVELKKLKIVPANPQIIWRVPLSAQCRLAAINCYELTSVNIKSLLAGRVELLNTVAFNEDVSLFDGQAKSFSYDFFGFVSIINSGLKGGSCIYAPYRGEEHKKQKIHLHGERQFMVPAVEINIKDFRDPVHKHAKTPPAGYRVKS